jgi:hypothetical protein
MWDDAVVMSLAPQLTDGRRMDLPKALRPALAAQAWAIRRGIEFGRRRAYDFLGPVAVVTSGRVPTRRRKAAPPVGDEPGEA